MCSFLFTSKDVQNNLTEVNHFQKFRGPDCTQVHTQDGYTFVHNLLSITGEYTPQPFIEDDIVCIYNGEIYNFDSFGDYDSDGKCLIPLYKEYGTDFVKHLDGEFAIVLVDFSKDILIVSSDTFCTKPIFMGLTESDIAVSSYESAIKRLGFEQAYKVPTNTTGVYKLSDFDYVDSYQIKQFDISQHKNTYDDWIEAFQKSIYKRSRDLTVDSFLGLSSGYDSGAISCELNNQNRKFKTYTILASENKDVINGRCDLMKDSEIIELTQTDYDSIQNYVRTNAEDFYYSSKYMNYDFKNDKASVGLGKICDTGRKEGYRIYYSGQGADEILSDYGHNGNRIYNHSEFGGKFPESLDGFFPWYSFYDGTQIQYLNKEEYVAGTYGIETRYPFLDVDLVQEFLWLSSDLKNKSYKAPLREYLVRNNFPFDDGKKIGFSANKNLR